VKKILITGGTGMLGGYLSNSIDRSKYQVFSVGRNWDLRSPEQTERLFSDLKPNYVFHLAAKVGGLMANVKNNGAFFNENVLINTNVLNQALKTNSKVCSVLSTCIYPNKATYPLTEDQLHDGPPHESNFGYAYAKRMLEVHSRAYRQQYGAQFICAIPNNMYGENDNFDLEQSHVVPAVIRKLFEAKINKLQAITFWGDGSALREFTYAEDIAKDLIWLMENYNEEKPVNIGNTEELSIKDLILACKDILQYPGDILWDISKPNGQYRKPTSTMYFESLLSKKRTYTDLRFGLNQTIEWFKRNYPNIRGI
jgi:GDP-L-fucose synthase